MVDPVSRNEGYDDWLDALSAGEGYYLACPNGHGSLPPRRVCPRCGEEVEERPLPSAGEVETYTVVHVSTPQLEGDVPYVTAVAAFGPARLTGFLRVDPDDAAVGTTVEAAVGETAGGERALFLEPR